VLDIFGFENFNTNRLVCVIIWKYEAELISFNVEDFVKNCLLSYLKSSLTPVTIHKLS
jgi:hypothetical protein